MRVIYTDQTGSIETEICNNFQENGDNSKSLTMLLEGVSFAGSSFDDFELQNKENYTPQQLQRFTFNIGTTQSQQQIFSLCNCSMEFEIQTIIIDTSSKNEIPTPLSVFLQLGSPASNGGINFENADFQIIINNQTYKSSGEVFEDGLDKLKVQIAPQFHFKNCYGCLYADYSPYGNGFFQTMLCFKQQKNAYLELNKDFSKQAYFEVIDKGFILVQETYCCGEFEMRTSNIGYRG